MYSYDFALTFEKEINDKIHKFSEKLNGKMESFFWLSSEDIPHISVLKFEVEKKLSSEQILQIQKNSSQPLNLNFAGITFLPSKNAGIWVEIAVLKSTELLKLQKKAIDSLEGIKIKNKLDDNFRPHITISKIKNENIINAEYFDYEILRKKQVLAIPQMGYAGKNFEFFNI